MWRQEPEFSTRVQARWNEIETPYIAAAATVMVCLPLLFVLDVDSVILLPLYVGFASALTLIRRKAFAKRGREILMESWKVQTVLIFQALALGITLVALRDDLQPIVAGAFVVSWIAMAFFQVSFFGAVEDGRS